MQIYLRIYMKCNKIKIILYIYQSLTVILYNTYTKMSIDSCQTEGQQCIAFPHREKKRAKKRLTLRRSEKSQKKGRREDRGGRSRWVFCTCGTCLVPFPQDSSIIHERGNIQETEQGDGISPKHCIQLESQRDYSPMSTQ